MAKLLHSSAEDRLKRWRRLLTLQLYLRTGPFWDAMQKFRARWEIVPTEHVVTEADHLSFPPVCPEPAPTPRQPDTADSHDWTRDIACWQEDVILLMTRVIPEDYRIPHDLIRSLRLWFPFLAACVQYDPPEMHLLEFADQGLPIPETFFDATWTQPVADGPSTDGDSYVMVAPPVTTADPDHIAALHRWREETLLAELHRRLEPRGIDLKALVREVESDPRYWERVGSRRFAPDPNKASIVVTLGTTDEDVRHARKLIHDGFGTALRTGASERDPLTSVQVAIFHRRGWTVPRIANHFGWNLSDDEYGTPRRSSKVTDYIKQGEELLDQQKNSRS